MLFEHKNQLQNTLLAFSKIDCRNFKKYENLRIFDDFGAIFDFLQIFRFSGAHLWVSRALGNRQTNKKCQKLKKEFMEMILDTLNNVSSSKNGYDFSI